MNQEVNDFLKQNLLEAHATYNTIISEMKENNITFEYDVLNEKENESFTSICEMINKMQCNLSEYNRLKEDNQEIFDNEYSIYLKYFSLYIVSILFIKVFHIIFDTEKLSDILKYAIGMFLGSTYIGLLNKDIHDNRSDSKETRDLINRLKTLKEEYKENHDMAVIEIDYIFALNTNLWNKLDEGKKLVKNK